MIQYRKSDGTLGCVDESSSSCSVEVNARTFTIVRRIHGYDDYDFYDDRIEGIIELRIG
ncbi:MAG: hypothetical protein J6Y37_14375 [Paludibacteraceae bacterium]|nr:hypothetical protein [Paludibacteraceae bacterium]